MDPIVFFLAGLPVAFAAHRLIEALSDRPENEPDSTAGSVVVRRLPWQNGPWPARVRAGVAALVPLLMAVAGWRFGAVQAAAVSVLLVALLVCTATDLLRYRVPNAVTYPGTALAILATLLLPNSDPMSALAAAAIGGFVFLVVALVTKGGLGLGDVKLAVLIGAGLGLPAAYQALALGVLAGGLVIGALFITGVVGRRQAVPYAPFLALAAVAVVLLRGAAFAPL